jgi:hypothetical protein
MNERIRELVKQAGGHFSTHTLTSYPAQRRESIELWDKNIEKFAELIVWECAEQSMSIGRYNTPSGVTPDLSIAIAVGLKKHFGVTE